MLSLRAKIREKFGKQTKSLRKQGIIPAILYGEKVENTPLEVDEKEFEKVYKEAGESSLISLEIEGKNPQKFQVLIHDIDRDPLTGKFIHIDFYHPSSRKEVEAEIPLVLEGEAPAQTELGGILVKEIQVVEVRGLAQNLPREIKVDVTPLKTFEDRILIKDLKVPEGVTILRAPDEIVALCTPPEEEVEEEVPVEEEKSAEEEKPKPTDEKKEGE